MADGTTYGLNFPFRDSVKGDYLQLTELEAQEIKADLIFLKSPIVVKIRCKTTYYFIFLFSASSLPSL